MDMLSQDFKERVRAATDIVQVMTSYGVQLRRAGLNLLGLCPFHNEKTPSFNVRPSEQYFRCFGCGAKGDVFTFVQLLEKVEFPEALKMLAERAGIPLEYASPAAARDAAMAAEGKTRLLWCCSRALDYFEESLQTPAGQPARDYLLSRGFTPETITRWRLGWAPDSWDGLCGYLLKQAGTPEQRARILEAACLAGVLRAKEDERGGRPARHYDAFRGRVMFPITDAQSRPIAFGGRQLVVDPKMGGKYINSSEGRLFEKRKVLFGLAQAAKEIALCGKVVVVEGYTDVIMCHQYGIRNVIATLGTALTEEHVALLRRFVTGKANGGVIAFFDSDAAGEKATRRAVEMFMTQDVPLAVAGGLDPKDAAEFLPRHGVEAFRQHLDRAADGFTFVLNRTVGQARGGRDVMAMGAAVREVMEVVNLCPDPVRQALMRQRVAAEAGVPEATLPKPRAQAQANKQPGKAESSLGLKVPKPGVAAKQARRPAYKPGLAPPVPAPRPVEAALQRGVNVERRFEMRLLRYMWENREWSARVADAHPPDKWKIPALAELAALTRDEWEAGGPPVLTTMQTRAVEPGAAECLAELAFPDPEPLSELDLSRLLERADREDRQEQIRLYQHDIADAVQCGDEQLAAEIWAEQLRLKAASGKTGKAD